MLILIISIIRPIIRYIIIIVSSYLINSPNCFGNAILEGYFLQLLIEGLRQNINNVLSDIVTILYNFYHISTL